MAVRIDILFLTFLFVTLKLFGAIEWSWWWVFSPLWITFLLAMFVAVVFGIAHCIKDMKG